MSDSLPDSQDAAGARKFQRAVLKAIGPTILLAASLVTGGAGGFVTTRDTARETVKEQAKSDAIQDLRIINLENERLNLKTDLFNILTEQRGDIKELQRAMGRVEGFLGTAPK